MILFECRCGYEIDDETFGTPGHAGDLDSPFSSGPCQECLDHIATRYDGTEHFVPCAIYTVEVSS